MEGIKIAFHTSIYGLVLSLVYNFVYRASMEAVYTQLEEFLSTFDTYVLGDAYNDNESSMRELLQALPEQLGASVSQQMSAASYNMSKTMKEFAETVSETQTQGMRTLVSEFIEQLNVSMGNSYSMFGRVINETVEVQRQNNAYAQTIMDRLGTVAGNVNDINTLSAHIIDSMSGYIGEIEKLQNIVNENYSSTYRQMEMLKEHEERMQGYVYAISAHEKEVNDSIRQELAEIIKMSGAFSGEIQSTTQKLSNVLSGARSEIDAAAKELASASTGLDERLAASINQTFDLFDTNMAQITDRLNETVSSIDSTTQRVPEVVLAAYNGMKQSFDAMQEEMNKVLQMLHQ